MGKKGGMEWYIIGFLLAIGILVVLVIGPGKFLLYISNLFSYAPSDLSSMSLACKGYVTGNFPDDYCKFRDVSINDIKQYANCEHTAVQANLAKEDVDVTGFDCGADAIKNYCIKNKWNTLKDKHVVNGVGCKTVPPLKTCVESEGEKFSNLEGCVASQKTQIQGTFSDITSPEVCCK